jgi:hypothetical protein
MKIRMTDAEQHSDWVFIIGHSFVIRHLKFVISLPLYV